GSLETDDVGVAVDEVIERAADRTAGVRQYLGRWRRSELQPTAQLRVGGVRKQQDGRRDGAVDRGVTQHPLQIELFDGERWNEGERPDATECDAGGPAVDGGQPEHPT